MCGRYFIDTTATVLEYYQQLLSNHSLEEVEELTTKEIFPSTNALVLRQDRGEVIADILKWGYPNFDRTKMIINTRSETALEKPMFKKDYLKHRCVIVATGFFEWSASKDKYLIHPEEDTFYMAGIYDEEKRVFSILTKDSYFPLSDIHPRTPILLDYETAKKYVQDDASFHSIVKMAHQKLYLEKVIK